MMYQQIFKYSIYITLYEIKNIISIQLEKEEYV